MNWYKIAQENMIISFDFDQTLFKGEWDPIENDFKRDTEGNIIGELNESVARMVHHYAGKNIKIIIVSSRMDQDKNEIIEFAQKYNLPISEFYCTNGQDKVHILKSLGVSKHFDDDKFEIDKINQDGQLMGILV